MAWAAFWALGLFTGYCYHKAAHRCLEWRGGSRVYQVSLFERRSGGPLTEHRELGLHSILVREAKATDESFIYATWLRSYRNSEFARHQENDKYYWRQHDLIEKLMKGNQVNVAVIDESPDVVLGWACGRNGLLHYSYVKKAFRRLGIAKKLVTPWNAGAYSHRTLMAPLLMKHALYDPYLAFI